MGQKKGGRVNAMTSRSDSMNSNRSAEPFSQFDYAIDFSKYKSSMFQLLNPENRSRWFEISSNNALLSFLISVCLFINKLAIFSKNIFIMFLASH